MATLSLSLIILSRLASLVGAITHPYEIQGTTWAGALPTRELVTDVQGVVSAVGKNFEFWITGARDNVEESSDAIYVQCSREICGKVRPREGARVTIDGMVARQL